MGITFYEPWDSAKHPRDFHGQFRSVASLRNRLLGGAVDTQQRYGRWDSKRGYMRYSRGRKALHDSIVGKFLAEGVRHAGGVKPEALLMAGGPGSGKSSVLHTGLVAEPPTAVHIDADAIKEMLPEYQRLVNAGDKQAARAVHEESSDIARRIQYEAERQGFNLVIDGTGNGKPGAFRGKIDELAKRGYEVDVVVVNASVDHALDRVHKRADATGRFVPDSVVRQLHRSISRRLPEILSADTRTLTIYDNDKAQLDKPVKIVEKSPKLGYVVYDEDQYERLFEKADAHL